MRRIAFGVLFIVLSAVPAELLRAEGDVGVGFILGNPTGFSMIIADRVSLGIGWGILNYLHVNADVWVVDQQLEGGVDWHVGVGGKVKVFNENTERTTEQRTEDADLAAGIRFPVSIQYFFSERLELFGEAAPGIEVYPGFDLDVDVGLGLRYRL
mgnify:CR=1 FL=1